MNLTRRQFVRKGALSAVTLSACPMVFRSSGGKQGPYPVRLGAPLPGKFNDPVEWIKSLKSLKYSAAYCPLQPGVSSESIKAFRSVSENWGPT